MILNIVLLQIVKQLYHKSPKAVLIFKDVHSSNNDYTGW